MIEAEIKVSVDDLSNVRNRLRELKATFITIDEEADVYFNHPLRDFAQTDEALRVRRTGADGISVTYKGPKFRLETKTREEISVIVGDYDAFIKILKCLDFKPIATILKVREKWKLRDVNVYLDEVKGLGSFVELEAEVKSGSSLSKFEDKLFKILDLLGLNKHRSTRKSYLELILKPAMY